MKLKDKRVAIFIWQDWHHSRSGGAEYYCRRVTETLIKNGAAVTVVACRDKGGLRKIDDNNLQVVRVGPRAFIVLSTFFWYLRHKKEFDLVIDFTNKVPYLTPLYVRKPLIAAFMHINGETFKDEWGIFGFLGRSIETLLLKPYRKHPAIAISESTKEELAKRGFKQIEVAIVPTTWSVPKVSRPDKKPRIVVVSRLRKYKRLSLLLKSIAIVKQSIPKIKLDIIGRGPDKKRLQRLTRKLLLTENVAFRGYVNDVDRDVLMSQAWLTVITSRKEGWGITVSEAAQFGIPAVGVDAPGTRDAIIDWKTGRLVKQDRPDKIAEAIVALLNNPTRRKQMGQAAQRFAQSYTIDRLEAAWLSIITRL